MSDDISALPTYEKARLQTVAHKQVREVVSGTLKKFQLNTTQWMILGILHGADGDEKISAIAQRLQVEVPLITTLAQPLLAIGLIEQHADQADRRSKPLSLTESGAQLLKKAERQLTDNLKLLETGLSQADINQYFATLNTFIANAEKIESGELKTS